jgi:hypothetical protein
MLLPHSPSVTLATHLHFFGGLPIYNSMMRIDKRPIKRLAGSSA